MRYTTLIFSCIILFCTGQSFAQEKLYYANDALAEGRYKAAIQGFSDAFKKKNTFEAAFKLGYCYELTQNFDEAESWYKRSIDMPNSNDSLYPYLANVLRLNGKYDEAKMYYKILSSKTEGGDVEWDAYVESCENARLGVTKSSNNLIFKIPNINDSTSEFPSMVKKNELYFSSNRSNQKPLYKLLNPENELPYYSLFATRIYDGVATEIINVTTKKEIPSHEGPVAAARNNQVYLTANTVDDISGELNPLDIYVGTLDANSRLIGDLEPFEFNTEEYSEGQVYISEDGNRLYFASNRPQSFGGSDIFVCQRRGKGWSEPVNLGANINTEYDELFPFEMEGKELYFTSNRPESFGGYDIFASQQNNSGWAKAVQLPAPINSSRDDFAMIFLKDTRTGYMASNRNGGVGMDDIYRFELPDVPFVYDSSLVTPPLPINDPVADFPVGKETEPKKLTPEQIIAESNKEKILKIENLKLTPIAGDSLFTMRGKVKQLIDSLGQPFDNTVMVIIIDTCGNQRQTYTNKDGEFVFNKLDDQPYTIRAIKDDYFTNTMEVELIPPRTIEIISDVNILDNIEYEFNSSSLTQVAKIQLNRLVKVMKAKPNYSIDLQSYTDARGSDAYNLALSKRRASSVKTYLIEQGIQSKRIRSEGLGEANLIVKNAQNDEQHQLNRRTEFRWLISK